MKIIGAIKDSLSKCSNFAITKRIAHLLQKMESWSIKYIHREKNIETDRITKMTFDRESLQLFKTSPFESL